MKIRKSSRVMALVLALMMIVPLIGVPTFAEDAQAPASNLLWSEDLEDYTADADLVVDSSFTTVKGKPVIKEADGNRYVHLTYGDDNKDKDFRVNGVALSYETTPVVVLSADYYVSSEATGQTISQFRYLKNSGDTKGYFSLFSILPTSGTINGAGLSKNAATFPLDQWNNVKLVIDMVSGDIELYVNNVLGAEWNSGYTNLSVDANNWIISKLDTSTSVTRTGYSCVDNIEIYNGVDGLSLKKYILSEDFSTLTAKADSTTVSDTTAAKYGYVYAAALQDGTNTYLQVPFKGTGTSDGGSGNYDKVTTLQNRAITSADGVVILEVKLKPHFVELSNDATAENYCGYECGTPVTPMMQIQAHISYPKDGVATNLNYASFAQINLKSGALSHTGVLTGAAGLVSDAWNTLRFVIDLEQGLYDTYVNDVMYATHGNISTSDNTAGVTNATIKANSILIAKANKGVGTFNNKDGVAYNDMTNVCVDDIAVYTDSAVSYSNKDFINVDFENETLNSAPATGFSSLAVSNSTVVTAEGGSKAWNVPFVGADSTNINKNPKISNPKLAYNIVSQIVYETDFFIKSDAIGQLQTQFTSSSPNNSTAYVGSATSASTVSWVDMYQIAFDDANSDEAIVKFESGTNVHANSGKVTMKKGVWNRVSLVINLETGIYDMYINGVLVYDGAQLYRSGKLTKITIAAGQIIVGGKINNDSVDTKYTDYTGAIQLDNIRVYPGIAPSMLADSWVENFDACTSVPSNSSSTVPSSATLVDGLSGQGVRLTIGPQGSREDNSAGYEFVYYNSRAVNISTTQKDGVTTSYADFVAFQDGDVYYAYTIDKLSCIKFEKNDDGKTITVLGLYTTKTAFTDAQRSLDYFKGIFATTDDPATEDVNEQTWAAKNDKVDIRSSLAYLEMYGVGSTNIDRVYKLKNYTFKVGAYSKVVLETKFNVSADAKGDLESQFNVNTWQNLYSIDATKGTLNGAKFNKGEWNTVNIVIDLASTGKGDVYLNGIYVGQTGANLLADGITTGEWSVMKVKKGTNIDNFAGTITLDDISISVLNDADLINVPTTDANGDKLNYVEVGGEKLANTTKFYAIDGFTYTPVYFNTDAYANLITTINKASIRLGDAANENENATTTGIRFATQINDMDLFNALKAMEEGTVKSVVFGTLIAPKDYVGEGELTKALGEGKYLDVQANYDHYFAFDQDDATTHFVGSITNVFEANIGRTFTARGYVEITLLSGQVVTIYGGVVERSVKQVAAAALADQNASWTPEEINELQGYTNVADWVAPAN